MLVVRVALASFLVACTVAQAQVRPSQPEPPSGWTPKKLAQAKQYMVAAANPLAVEAGLRMLEQGGNAVDAMVATQLALNLVEPSSSGLGGGAFFLYYDAKAKKVTAIAAGGADAFYSGDIAKDMVAAVRGHQNAGTLTLDDLASYRVRDVEPLCGTYRAWRLCGMPPSSSGGIAVLQILGALERFDMASV